MSLQECPRFYLSANIYKEKNSIQKIFVRTYLLTQQLPSYNDSLTCKHGGYMLNVNILQPDDWMLNLISATVLFPQKESFVSHHSLFSTKVYKWSWTFRLRKGRRWDFVDQSRKVFLDPFGISFFSDDRRPQRIKGKEKKKGYTSHESKRLFIPAGNCFQWTSDHQGP